MEWHDFVLQLLNESTGFDEIGLSFDDSEESFKVPPIIKASVLMLDRMLEHQGNHNILVFPEKVQSIFVFALIKLLHNISVGRIEQSYAPEKFVPGEKLRLGKAVAEFQCIEDENGQKKISLRLADLKKYSAPIDFFPMFQKTTAKRISKSGTFAEALKEAKKELTNISSGKGLLALLREYKTHMDSSIVFVSSMINTKQAINEFKLCDQSIKDTILIGQADFEGNVRNIGTGQLSGIPAIVLASDLYAVNEMVEKEHSIQSVIIDASNVNAIESQLPELDKLLRLKLPVTCVTDVANSFDLHPLLERDFNLWRWDETCITNDLYDASPIVSDRKTKCCANRKVEYLVTDGNEISTAIRLLYTHRKESQTASAQMLKLFARLFSLAFTALRETVPFGEDQCDETQSSLEECEALLTSEKPYLPDVTYNDYRTIINSLKAVFIFGYILPKHESLAEKLIHIVPCNVCLVVPERSNKEMIQQYWQNWCIAKKVDLKIEVLFPTEYCLAPCGEYGVVIVVGWLKPSVMRRTMYSFNTSEYIVLLYDYEKRWKNYNSSKWNQALTSEGNRKIIEKSFSTNKLKITTSRFVAPVQEPVDLPKEDELSEIEIVLRENKYRRYVAGGKKEDNDTIEAIPVNYVGGYLAFYKTGHKIISASSIIESDSDTIETKYPNQLKVGDFVVVREVDRDIVKEMADIILKHSGMEDKRAIAGQWREALKIETLFYTPEQIFERLQLVGCTRGLATVRSWIFDNDMIAPQSKQDLEHIAAITENEVMKERLDQIYSAAKIVKIAHVQAGRVLSDQLRAHIAKALKEHGNIDPFNIWKPIEMMIDGIGTVRILKIIDIGDPVTVYVSDTNRLIDEE